jgi:hypothetical protein
VDGVDVVAGREVVDEQEDAVAAELLAGEPAADRAGEGRGGLAVAEVGWTGSRPAGIGTSTAT